MSITSMTNRARMAEGLTIQQLQQSIQDGVVPSYIGVPLLKSKVEEAKMMQAAKAAQGMAQQPSVAQQIMAQAQQVDQGVDALPTNLPTTGMAGGGIVAFAEGGMYDDEDSDEDRLDAERQAEIEDLMNEYARTFQSGIGQLPAAATAAPSGREGIAGGDAADFVARIMHKESRGRRYDKDGNLLTSEKGAMGEMQVMPGTVRDPGFGVKAARDNSPDELARVGRDYAQTLLARYGDPKLAAIAYNMGPGATDKWLAAGADVSKLPKETQGYVKGFANGGAIRFQNRGLVDGDFSTIEGLEAGNLYAEAIKRAQAEREQKKKAEPTENEKRYSGLWPYNAPEAGKFSYQDAAKFDDRKTADDSVAVGTRKPGITYAPNYGYGNVAPVKRTPVVADETPSEYGRQMGNVAGFFGDLGKSALSGIATLGKHIVSAPGYGFSDQGRPAETKAVAQQKPIDFTQFDAATARYMNDRDQARLAAARADELGLRSNVADAALNARIDKALSPAASPAASAAAANASPVKAADPYAEFRDIFKQREANLAKQREQDKYMALLQAGLGMMGGTSPNALANIGAGATQGLQSLAEARKAATAEENALLSGRLGLAKIGTAKEQADAMMQLRKDLATKADERARDLAAASLEEKQAGRISRDEDKALKRLADISKNAEIQAEKAISANSALNFAADRESKKQAMIADILRRNATYAKNYQIVHGKDADPFEGLGQTKGGGTRIRFDAQGNMIQ